MRAYHRVDPIMDERKSHYTPAQFGAFLKVQLVAGRQSEPGTFRSLAALRRALPAEYARHVPFLLAEGDLVVLPDRTVEVDGWREWQEGDLTVGERMKRLRERKRYGVTPDDTPPVTPDDTDGNPETLRPEAVTSAVTQPSPAAIGVGYSSSVSSSNGSSTTPKAVLPRERLPESLRRLTKEQLELMDEEWSSFADPVWAPFKEAWTGRGLIRPPFGSEHDDAGTSQRTRLYRIADARPHDLGRWVQEAPQNLLAHGVIAYIFAEWAALEEEVGVHEELAVEAQRRGRMEPVGGIVLRLVGKSA